MNVKYDFESILPALGTTIYYKDQLAYLKTYNPEDQTLEILTKDKTVFLTFEELTTYCLTCSKTSF